MVETKYQELLIIMKASNKNLRKDVEISKSIDLCSKCYTKAKDGDKYYEKMFMVEADKTIKMIDLYNETTQTESKSAVRRSR